MRVSTKYCALLTVLVTYLGRDEEEMVANQSYLGEVSRLGSLWFVMEEVVFVKREGRYRCVYGCGIVFIPRVVKFLGCMGSL